MVSPDSVLAGCLVRVSALTHYRHQLPAIVGRVGTLDFFTLVVAPPGFGKGGAMDTADELIPGCNEEDGNRVQIASFGSGEGMGAAYFRMVEEDVPGPGHKTKMVKTRYYNGVLFSCDEGSTYKALAERTGQTTPDFIRNGFSGERLGNSYVGVSRGVGIPKLTYRMAIVMAIQPVNAQKLLGEWESGTPHRFIYMTALDSLMPEVAPKWPGPLKWQPYSADVLADPTKEHQADPIAVTGSVEEEIRARHRGKHLGEWDPGRYDSHRDLLRLKVAALLGRLSGRQRLEVTTETWKLAGMVLDTSDSVRDSIVADIAESESRTEKRGDVRAARRTVAVTTAELDTVEARSVERVANVLGRACSKSPGLTTDRLIKKTASRDRHLADLALKRAESLGLLTRNDDGLWHPAGDDIDAE